MFMEVRFKEYTWADTGRIFNVEDERESSLG